MRIPLCLVVILSVSIDDSKASDATGVQSMAVSDTASQTAPRIDARADPSAPDREKTPASESTTADELQGELATARTELQKARARTLAAEAVAEQQRRLATLERKENASLREDVDELRKDFLDALKSSGTREENLLRELVAANRHLADMQRRNADLGAQRALMAIAAEDQTTRTAELTSDLVLAQRELQRVRTQANAIRKATEASLAATMDALEAERRKNEFAERDLAAARQSIARLEASERLAARKQADLLRSEQSAEVAAKEAGDALKRERERATGLAKDLANALRETAVAQQETQRVSAAASQALQLERDKALVLTRDLASARKAVDTLKRRAASSRHVTKASAVTGTGKNTQRRLLPAKRPNTITLPNALRPIRPPAEGSLQ